MITLKRLNEVRQVASEEPGRQAGEEGLYPDRRRCRGGEPPVTKADLEKLGDALLDPAEGGEQGRYEEGRQAQGGAGWIRNW